MAYAKRHQIGTNRTLAIIIVAILHVAFGYALITGLAYNVVEQTVDRLKTFDVEDEPPPPPEEPPPPPPKEVKEVPPPAVAPPPIVRTKVAPPPKIETVRAAPPPVVTPTAPVVRPVPPAPAPPPPPPPPVKTVPPRSAVGNLQGLFRVDDYPDSALDREEQGTVVVRLTVGVNGRVQDCKVTRSSGSSALDRTSCRVLQNRARFTPATDNRGQPMVDTVNQRIRWELAG